MCNSALCFWVNGGSIRYSRKMSGLLSSSIAFSFYRFCIMLSSFSLFPRKNKCIRYLLICLKTFLQQDLETHSLEEQWSLRYFLNWVQNFLKCMVQEICFSLLSIISVLCWAKSIYIWYVVLWAIFMEHKLRFGLPMTYFIVANNRSMPWKGYLTLSYFLIIFSPNKFGPSA